MDSVDVVFPPKQTTILEFTLKTPGPAVETRPDLGIGADDVKVEGGSVSVTVHSLGAVDAPAGTVEIVDMHGKVLAHTATPQLRRATRDDRIRTPGFGLRSTHIRAIDILESRKPVMANPA